jgi:hypothetical protein
MMKNDDIYLTLSSSWWRMMTFTLPDLPAPRSSSWWRMMTFILPDLPAPRSPSWWGMMKFISPDLQAPWSLSWWRMMTFILPDLPHDEEWWLLSYLIFQFSYLPHDDTCVSYSLHQLFAILNQQNIKVINQSKGSKKYFLHHINSSNYIRLLTCKGFTTTATL